MGLMRLYESHPNPIDVAWQASCYHWLLNGACKWALPNRRTYAADAVDSFPALAVELLSLPPNAQTASHAAVSCESRESCRYFSYRNCPDRPGRRGVEGSLNEDVRIQKRGQPIHAKVLEPIYVFDKQVIPAGSEVTGKIMDIASIPKEKRALAAMNADFSPVRTVRIEFDGLLLPSGQHMAIKTDVFPGSAGVLQFIPADQKKKTATEEEKKIVSRKIDELRQQVKGDWHTATEQLHSPNKFHRIERYAVGRLPYHPQYLDTGTAFDAELLEPLNFGSEPMNTSALSSIGLQAPSVSLVHAILLTPLNSATNKRGDPVAAEITQPLVVGGRLLLPEGSRLGRVHSASSSRTTSKSQRATSDRFS